MQLNENLTSFTKRQVNIVAISTDTTDVLANFSERRTINFTLLSDQGAKIIRAFGLLNAKWNMPHPASVFVDGKGVVRAVLRKKSYLQRGRIPDMLQVVDETLVPQKP